MTGWLPQTDPYLSVLQVSELQLSKYNFYDPEFLTERRSSGTVIQWSGLTVMITGITAILFLPHF